MIVIGFILFVTQTSPFKLPSVSCLIQDKIGWKPTVFLEKWINQIISMKKFDEI